MVLVKSIILIALLQISFTAYADESGLSDEFSACVKKSKGATEAMSDCIAAETKWQNRRLNKVYNELMSGLSPDHRKRLQETQRLWIMYRDANCSFYAEGYSECLMKMTAERAKELEALIEESGQVSNAEEGSVSQIGSKYQIKKFEQQYGDCDDSEKNCVSLDIQYPEITESPSKVATDSVNDFARKFVLRPIFEGKNPEAFQELMNQFVETYKSVQKEIKPDYAFGWSVERDVEVIYNTPKVLSLSLSEYSFTGGAHPNSFINYASFNMSTGEEIRLSDILIDGYGSDLNRIAEKEFRKIREMKPDESLEDAGFWFENNKFSLNDNFAIIEEGLIFYFNSYEIAPYVMGPTEIVLSYEDFKHLIKEDGLLTEGNKS
ncbi:MAG TPA: lysozyme inhibitor LprI family protein [Thermodesulfobacteriota bacterium]|nr:lysozyme inhibitor LprI family protein [Thermodesulfobacteriota bacterium]